MNRKGFTLMELIAVITLLALIMLLIVPGLGGLSASNEKKEYQTYEDMMVEYAKTMPNTKFKSDGSGKFICLKDLGVENVNSNVTCQGYVRVINNKYSPYLQCSNSGKVIYTTGGYNLPNGC